MTVTMAKTICLFERIHCGAIQSHSLPNGANVKQRMHRVDVGHPATLCSSRPPRGCSSSCATRAAGSARATSSSSGSPRWAEIASSSRRRAPCPRAASRLLKPNLPHVLLEITTHLSVQGHTLAHGLFLALYFERVPGLDLHKLIHRPVQLVEEEVQM